MPADLVSMDMPRFAGLRDLENDPPFEMLNLVRFRDAAEYAPDDPEYAAPAVTGEVAFRRYVAENRTLPSRAPGGITWQCHTLMHLIAPENETWDLVFLRSYDAVSSFVKMISAPEYIRARRHRTAGIAESRLIMCQPCDVFANVTPPP